MKKIFIFLLFISIISCKKEKSVTDMYAGTTRIYHQEVFDKDELILQNGEILYFNIDSSLIIQNFKDDSLMIKLSLRNKRITHFIPLGNGPNEFVDVNLSQRASDSTLFFLDVSSSQLYQLNIITGEISKDLAYDNSRCIRMVKIDDHYFSSGVFEEGMFAIWKNNGFLTYAGDYPKDKMDNKNMASKGLAYQGKLLANEGLNRLFFCSTYFSYFELFQIDSGTISSIKKSYIGNYEYVPSQNENIVFAHPYENNREGYIDADATNERIYLLYSGRSIEDINIDTHEEARLANQILVYDWNGTLIAKYETDVDLEKICVNDAENIIYAIAYDPDPEIVFFEL